MEQKQILKQLVNTSYQLTQCNYSPARQSIKDHILSLCVIMDIDFGKDVKAHFGPGDKYVDIIGPTNTIIVHGDGKLTKLTTKEYINDDY